MRKIGLKQFVGNYEGNFAVFICTFLITVYPILYFLISYVYLESFVFWNLLLLMLLPLFCFSWFIVARMIHIKKNLPSVRNIFVSNLNSFLRYPELIFFALFLIYAFVSSLLSSDPMLTIFGVNYHRPLEGYIMFLFYAFCLYLGFKLKQEKYKFWVILAFFFSASLICVLTYIDSQNKIFASFIFSNTTWASLFVNSNHYGYFLTMAIMLSTGLFITQKKLWLKITAGIMIVAFISQLVFNNTLGSNLAVFASLIFIFVMFCIKEKKFVISSLFPLVVFVLASIVIPTGMFYQIIEVFSKDLVSVVSDPLSENAAAAGTKRWELWLESFEVIKSHPFFGDGMVYKRPHNEYLQYAQVWGIPALILYLCGIISLFVRTFRNLRKLSDVALISALAVGGYLVSALFGNTMPHIMPFFCLLLGLMISAVPDYSLNKKIDTHLG